MPQFTRANWAARRKEFANQFPGAYFGDPGDAKRETLEALENALRAKKEEALQKVLTQHPYLFRYAVDGSGHHGTWVFPKQMIKPPASVRARGLIPDFLVVTRSSLGYFWHIVELKRADVQFSNSKGTGYSAEAQKGLVQCSGYLRHFSDYIDTVRNNIRINELIRPVGAILLIGDSDKESAAQLKCRSDFVRTNSGTAVVSYRRIVRGLESDLLAFKR